MTFSEGMTETLLILLGTDYIHHGYRGQFIYLIGLFPWFPLTSMVVRYLIGLQATVPYRAMATMEQPKDQLHQVLLVHPACSSSLEWSLAVCRRLESLRDRKRHNG